MSFGVTPFSDRVTWPVRDRNPEVTSSTCAYWAYRRDDSRLMAPVVGTIAEVSTKTGRLFSTGSVNPWLVSRFRSRTL
jgi:hypothetical protein